MRLLLPLLLLLLAPLFAICAAVFAVGIALRLAFVVALLFATGFLLFGRSLLRGFFRIWKFRSQGRPSSCSCRRVDARASHDSESFAFEGYRRATLRRLEEEAKEFRAFLAKLRNRADARDFQDFLRVRREGGPRNS